MYSKKLRRRNQGVVHGRIEPKKKRLPFGKAAYIIVWAFVLIKLGMYLIDFIFYTEGIGYVDADVAYVEARYPGRITRIACLVNDSVYQDQPLVFLSDAGFPFQQQYKTGDGAALRQLPESSKIIKAQNDLKLISKELQFAIREVRSQENEVKRARELLQKRAITNSNYLTIAAELQEKQKETAILRTKLRNAKNNLFAVESEYLLTTGSPDHRNYGSIQGEQILFAPGSSIVVRIFKQRGEIAQMGEPVLKLANLDSTFIRAYFAGKSAGLLHPGDEVSLHFENGDKISGHIARIHPLASTPPAELRGQFGSIKKLLVTDIEFDEKREPARVLETRVKIYKSRWW